MIRPQHYRFFSGGDLNALFALFLDNIINLVILASILIFAFGFPEEIVYAKMLPGTALGVFLGDLLYTWQAWRLARKTGRSDVTAIPLGLDTPSTIGMAVVVLGPVFLHYRQSMPVNEAATLAWYVGMGSMLWMGLVKLGSAFAGQWIQKSLPAAGLLGSLAGIGIVWLGAEQFVKTMEIPLVGLISLAIIMLTLMARYQIAKIPGAALAVAVALAVYYLGGLWGLAGIKLPSTEGAHLALSLPFFYSGGFEVMFSEALKVLPVAIPFALMTVIGGINVSEGARLAGDNYKTRDVLLIEALATLLAGASGGVSQTTPYIGHSAYKKMGAGAGYTLFTAFLVGLGTFLGLVGYIVHFIPEAAVSPILMFIGFEIAALAYQMTPANHNMAVTFAILPAILNYVYIKLKMVLEPLQIKLQALQANTTDSELASQLQNLVSGRNWHEYSILQSLGQGFILTSVFWGSALAFLIDGKAGRSALTLAIAGIFAAFGIIHSVTSSGEIYLPWNLMPASEIPLRLAMAYLASALLVFVLAKAAKHADH